MGGASANSSLMISELYVPRNGLPQFLAEAANDLRSLGIIVIYGTVRLIEKDTESFLPWATQAYPCVIFNVSVDHSPNGLERARIAFRSLIDRALARGGNYFLTCHRFATRTQLQTGYPKFDEFLAMKKQYDPTGLFQSDWYRHYQREWSG